MRSIKLLRKPELMAPAGDWACLSAALQAGADAVYFGVSNLNMRSNYRNFRPGEMKRIAGRCHQAGARAYLALNTILYEHELSKLDRILSTAREAQIDAVICADVAVIQAARSLELPVFLSTQLSLSNSRSLAFYYQNFGIRRFVLARECSLEQIGSIKRGLAKQLGEKAREIELEVFAHGAMCVSLSGRCFLSEERFGKSANRGQCLQPCRREYTITDVEGTVSYRLGDNYLLSPEDLCTMPFLDRLLEAGVASLKIEGRARTPEYVSTVTGAYRKALDYYFEHKGRRDLKPGFELLKTDLLRELDSVYHRGLSSGFFMGAPVDQWTTTRGSRAKKSKRLVGNVLNYYRRHGAAEIHVRNAPFKLGDELLVQGPTTGSLRVKVDSIQVERKPREAASRGELVAVRVPEQVRRSDRVFLVTAPEA